MSKCRWMTSIPKGQSSGLSLQMCKVLQLHRRECYLDVLQLRFIVTLQLKRSVGRALVLFNARHVVPIEENSVFCLCLLASVHICGVWTESQCVSECTCAVVFALRALRIRYSVSESTPGRLLSHSVKRKTFHMAANFSNCLPAKWLPDWQHPEINAFKAALSLQSKQFHELRGDGQRSEAECECFKCASTCDPSTSGMWILWFLPSCWWFFFTSFILFLSTDEI